MKTLLIILISICFNTMTINAQVPPNDKNWEVDFIENFDYLNTTRWNIGNNFDHYGEPQMYTNRPANVYISNGDLVLKIIQEDYMLHDYTSGWINTFTKYQFGYFEINCKLPKGKGFWPAFWLFGGVDCNEGIYNEIDIFEMSGRYPTIITNNLHHCGTINHYAEQSCPDYSTNYHSYSAEWTPDRIVWYLDDQNIRNEKNSFGLILPQYLVANLAIFPWELPNNLTPFPSYMYINSIKVYKLKMDCGSIVNDISNFDTFNFAVKKSISLGSLTQVPSNSKITLRATDFLQLNQGFEVPLGSEFSLYSTICY